MWPQCASHQPICTSRCNREARIPATTSISSQAALCITTQQCPRTPCSTSGGGGGQSDPRVAMPSHRPPPSLGQCVHLAAALPVVPVPMQALHPMYISLQTWHRPSLYRAFGLLPLRGYVQRCPRAICDVCAAVSGIPWPANIWCIRTIMIPRPSRCAPAPAIRGAAGGPHLPPSRYTVTDDVEPVRRSVHLSTLSLSLHAFFSATGATGKVPLRLLRPCRLSYSIQTRLLRRAPSVGLDAGCCGHGCWVVGSPGSGFGSESGERSQHLPKVGTAAR